MIDVSFLRENGSNARDLLLRKDPQFPIDKLIELDAQVRFVRTQIEALRAERNELSKKGAGGITEQVRARSIEIGKDLKAKEAELETTETTFSQLLLSCPNIPQSDLPLGGKESNKAVRVIGQKQEFSFTPKNHVQLNERLGWLDFESAVKMSGGQFVLYKKDAVKMMYALTDMMLKNNASHGFTPVIPPYLVQEQTLVNSGNLPKFKGDFYETQDGLNLIPTAEVSLTSIHAGEILSLDQLPLRYTAWTPCFRREAGGYGSQDRGLIRVHQFEKVEIYSITETEKSNEELEMMVACAETLLKKLGLHYRVSLLAAQDCSFGSARTYDIELWLPGQGTFYEVSSSSNCTDFQARRAGIRYRANAEAKPKLVHTLNASSLALPRLMVALMEQYQQADGTVKLPAVLQDAMNKLW